MTDGVESLSNITFERRALGVALRYPGSASTLTSSLTRDDFFSADHQAVFDCIKERVLTNREVDIPLVSHDLATSSAGTSNIADLPYLLWDEAGSEAALGEYIEIIRSAADARSLMALGEELRRKALETNGEKGAVGAALLHADDQILSLTDRITDTEWTSIVDVAKSVESGESQLEPLFGSGFPDLDNNILNGGFRPGQLVVVGARPAMGKSTVTLDFARHAAFHVKDCPGLHISLEMNADEIGSRLLAAETSIPLNHVVQNTLSDEDRDRIESRIEQLQRAQAPLYVSDSIDPTLPAIVGLIRAAHRRLGIKFVTVDYLQLLTSDGLGTTDRQQTVANISRSLKALARSLGIVIFLVSQLNRGSEQRTDKRPQVADLRESGQIEQDADIIMLIYRPEVHDPDTERGGEADWIIGKQRGGPTGTVVVNFQGHFARFVSAARSDVDEWDS